MMETKQKARRPARENKQTANIDSEIEDSFPASDPPSYSGGGRVGEPHRDERRRDRKKAPAKSEN